MSSNQTGLTVTNSNQVSLPAVLGIPVPEGFEVTVGNSRHQQCKYVRVLSQSYDTKDNQNDNPGQFREFLSLRKMAATILPVCASEGKYLLIRQFRFPAYYNALNSLVPIIGANAEEDGWLYETIAGVIEPGDTPEATVIREAKEEGDVDIDINDIRKVHEAYMTPGITNEVCHLYLGMVDKTSAIGTTGLASEQEQIRAKWMTRQEIQDLFNKGLIRDCKTIMALYAARVL